MASPMFQCYERNLRKVFWQQLVDRELEAARQSRFKASIVVNARDAMMVPRRAVPCLALPREPLHRQLAA